MVSPSEGIELPARTLLTLSQVHTFLTLVEECSVSRTSARLGLGASTVSAHIKAIEDDLGQRLFDRLPGGMVATRAGVAAYRQFRPLLARAAFCVDYVRRSVRAPAVTAIVAVPAGFAGSAIDAAFRAMMPEVRGAHPELCLLAVERQASLPADLHLTYVEPPATPDPSLVRDRWMLVRASSGIGLRPQPAPMSAVTGTELLVPSLPDPLQDLLSALARQRGIQLNVQETSVNGLLAQSARFNNFCAIVPAGLLNVAMAAKQFEVTPLEETGCDPWLALRGDSERGLSDAFRGELRAHLDAVSVTAREPEPHGEPEAITLKHARSFLALYEEGNVGRAARRLFIVQPALTVQLHRIEEQVGGKLFERTPQGLRANARADTLYGLLRTLMADFDTAVQQLRGTSAPPARVRVGLMPALDDESLMAEGFAVALDRWTGGHADSIVQVVEAYSNTLVRWLHAGRVDFAIIDQPVGDAALEIDTVATDALAVVVDEGSRLLPPGPVALERLARLPLVLPSSRHGLRALLSRELKHKGLALEPKVEVDSMAAALRLVRIAPYAAILPLGSVYKSRERRRLSVHEICEPRIARHICLARPMRPPSAAVLDLMQEVRTAFAHAAPAVREGAAEPAELLPTG